MAVKVLCGFVLLFQEIFSQVILPVVYIPACRKLILLPVAVAHFYSGLEEDGLGIQL